MNDALVEAFEKGQWYEVVRLIESDGLAADVSDSDCLLLFKALSAIGRRSTVADLFLTDPNALRRSPRFISDGLWAVLDAGRASEIVPALNSQNQFLQEPGLAAPIALCLQQTGATKNAAGILLHLVRNLAFNPILTRYAVRAVAQLTEADDFEALEAGLAPVLPTIPNPTWLKYELLRHTVPDTEVGAFPAADVRTIDTGKQAFCSISRGGERLLAGPGARIPDFLDQASLDSAVMRAFSDLQILTRDPWFAKRLAFLDAVRAEFAPKLGDPIQVISTGRVGTTALFALLEKSGAYAPYHGYSWHTSPKQRWHALNLLHSGDTLSASGLVLLRDYLSCRFTEIVRAYRHNRVPVLINHWDMIFSPFLKALFPGMSFLHMRRDQPAVINSLIKKRQYAYAQLIDLKFEAAPNTEHGVFRLPEIEELPRDVAWYIAFTEKFWKSLMTLNAGERTVELSSDALFNGQEAGIDALREAFPDIGKDDAQIADHFSVPINEKTERLFGLTERQSSLTDEAHDHLADFLSD